MDSFDKLYNHYTETCDIQRSSIKERNKFFVFLCLLIGLLFLLVISNNKTVYSINSLLKERWSLDFDFSSTIIQSVCWIFYLYVSMRYIQTTVYIERQYEYIHKLETILSEKGKVNIKREGEAYLKNYPFVSNYIDFIYKWVMPIIFILTPLLKIVLEIVNVHNNIALLFNIVIFILSSILWCSYLVFLHKGNK